MRLGEAPVGQGVRIKVGQTVKQGRIECCDD